MYREWWTATLGIYAGKKHFWREPIVRHLGRRIANFFTLDSQRNIHPNFKFLIISRCGYFTSMILYIYIWQSIRSKWNSSICVKSTRRKWKILPPKSKNFIDSSRYPNRLQRYRDSKRLSLYNTKDYEWSRGLHFFRNVYYFLRTRFSRNRLSGVWDRLVRARDPREDRRSKRLKITFLFTRRYRESKVVSK